MAGQPQKTCHLSVDDVINLIPIGDRLRLFYGVIRCVCALYCSQRRSCLAVVEVWWGSGVRSVVTMDSTVEPVDSFPYDRPTSLDDPNARLLRLWGKTTADPHVFHPTLYHMLDVGHVASSAR